MKIYHNSLLAGMLAATILLACGLENCVSATNANPVTWRERCQSQAMPFIGNYIWSSGFNDQLEDEHFRDARRMGLTGLVLGSYISGGHLFRSHGLYGLMIETYWAHPDLVMDRDGKPVLLNIYGCFSSERNVQAGADYILKFIKEHPEELCQFNGITMFSSWDETGLRRKQFCQCEHCRNLFRQYLKTEVYKDESPSADSGGDGRSFNAEAQTQFKTWEEVNLPRIEDRFKQPGLWKIYIDFVSWHTARFFTRIEAQVNAAGQPMAFITFYHSRMYWPGGGTLSGITPYYQARNSPIIVNEFCHADFPISTIASYWDDRSSKDYGKGVHDFSWFWPGHKGGSYYAHDLHVYNRSLAQKMGHTLHGLWFYYYDAAVYNLLPETSREIAYWHNFLIRHWDWLKIAEPSEPEVAVLFPGYAAYFYPLWQYPKEDFGWGPTALVESHYPFTVVQEEEVESGILSRYKALYVFGAERTSQKVLDEIAKFIDRGGFVFADTDSLLLNNEGAKSSLLADRFGIEPQQKFKSSFYPSVLSLEEQTDDPYLKNGVTNATRPLPRHPAGLTQESIDPAKDYFMDLDTALVPSGHLRTYHDIVTGTQTKGKLLGKFQGQPAAIETAQTVWFGNRPGFDLYAIYPKLVLEDMGETMYRGKGSERWYWSKQAAQRTDYRKVVAYLCEKAGIQRPAEVLRLGQPAPHVEVLVKQDAKTKGKMVFLINQGEIGGLHEVRIAGIEKGFEAWDVTRNELIEKNTDGVFSLDLTPRWARVVFVGPPAQVRAMAANQKALLDMDLSPVKLTVGPATLTEPPLPRVMEAPEIQLATLESNAVAQIALDVVNQDKQSGRTAEPVILPARLIAPRLNGLAVRSASLADGTPVQWDDVDGDGVFSPADELAWQSDFAPGEKKSFVVSLLSQPVPENTNADFKLSTSDKAASVKLGKSSLFTVGSDNSWSFPAADLSDRTWARYLKQPGARFFGGGEVKEPAIRVLGNGTVRKVIEVEHGYLPYKYTYGAQEERPAQTRARYAVYARQAQAETRIYAHIRHEMLASYRMGFRGDMKGIEEQGMLVSLSTHYTRPAWYKDTLGRTGSSGTAHIERNLGGWMTIPYGKGTLLGVLARRTTGIIAPTPIPSEADGIQIIGSTLYRRFINWNSGNIRTVIDQDILEGSVYELDCLLVVKETDKWQEIDALRQQYAAPPEISIENITVNN